MRTVALMKTSAARGILLVLMQLSMCCVIAGDTETTATSTPEVIDKPFIVDFQFGQKATPFVDPGHPPILELAGVTWNLRRLKADAQYHNLDSSEAKKVEGRRIDEPWTGLFWPYARLEVSNQWDGPWTEIGSSPLGTDGTEVVVLMYPDKAAYVDRSAPQSPTCYIDFGPFREFIGKYHYGRVVLRSGGVSQTIVLTDLLPPEPSPTPAPTAVDSSTPSQ